MTISTTSSIAFSLKFPFIATPVPVSIDLADYATPIAFVRGLCLACLAVIFFLVTIQTVRSVFV
jgi:hypothetical protein